MRYHGAVKIEIGIVQLGQKGYLERLCLTVKGGSGTEYMWLRLFQQVVSSIISFGFTVTSQENGMLLVTEMFKKE